VRYICVATVKRQPFSHISFKKNEPLLHSNTRQIHSTMQTRSQTRRQTQTPCPPTECKPAPTLPLIVSIPKINVSEMRPINRRIILITIKEYLKEITDAREKCQKKRIALNLYHFLTTDAQALQFLKYYLKFTFETIKKMVEFKEAKEFFEWETDYFLDKFKELVQTKHMSDIWASVLSPETVKIVWDDSEDYSDK
jgi:hypothetical protein